MKETNILSNAIQENWFKSEKNKKYVLKHTLEQVNEKIIQEKKKQIKAKTKQLRKKKKIDWKICKKEREQQGKERQNQERTKKQQEELVLIEKIKHFYKIVFENELNIKYKHLKDKIQNEFYNTKIQQELKKWEKFFYKNIDRYKEQYLSEERRKKNEQEQKERERQEQEKEMNRRKKNRKEINIKIEILTLIIMIQ